MDRPEAWSGHLEEEVEKLTEKRAATRESAFTELNKGLEQHYTYDWLTKRKETLLDGITKAGKRGGDAEVLLAFRTLGLIAITLGPEAESVYKEVYSFLDVIIRDHQRSVPVRSAAMDALAMLNFVGITDQKIVYECMEAFEKQFSDTIAESALRNWGLLATTLGSSFAPKLEGQMPNFVKFLAHGSPDVKLMAGENIALLVELARDRYAETATTEEAEFDIHAMDESTGVDMDEVLDALNELASERTRFQSKRDQLRQRAGFKDIARSVESGEFDPEVISINKTRISIQNWVETKQLNAFREFLGEGLHLHFMENDLLQQIFDTKISKEPVKSSLSQLEKRFIQSPNSGESKSRAKHMRSRGAVKGLPSDD